MLFIVYSSIDCMPMDSLINGKFIDTRQLNNVAQEYNERRRAVDVSAHQSFPLNTLDSTAIDESHSSNEAHKRVKRLHVFRPLFVYRQEQVKRRRIIEKRKLRDQTPTNSSTNDRPTSTTKKPCTNYLCCYDCRQF